MAAKNDITGDEIKSKNNSKQYEDNWDRIFGKKTDVVKPVVTPTQPAEYAEDWQSSERDRAIAQNGNVGYSLEEIYDRVENDYRSRD